MDGLVGEDDTAEVGQALPAVNRCCEGQEKQARSDSTMELGEAEATRMLSRMDIVPGRGIDFGHLGRILLWVLVIYVFASVFAAAQGRLTTRVVQRAVFRLREQVEAKLSRLPLRYFDGQPRGEVLSRATNDTDNVAQTLQQTLSQLLTSLLTIIGVLAVMVWISPLLALIALVTVPVSVFVTTRIGKRAQPQFIRQWASTGKLNGHIEEMFTGHTLVSAFGRQREAAETFDEHNDALYGASFRAQFISGTIQPAMMFFGNLNYVIIAVVGGLRVLSGTMTIGDIQAFIQYSRQFTQPLTQVASMANVRQGSTRLPIGFVNARRWIDAASSRPSRPYKRNDVLSFHRRTAVKPAT